MNLWHILSKFILKSNDLIGPKLVDIAIATLSITKLQFDYKGCTWRLFYQLAIPGLLSVMKYIWHEEPPFADEKNT